MNQFIEVRQPLLGRIFEPANVSTAWERVRRDRGCAGVDGVSIAELQQTSQRE